MKKKCVKMADYRLYLSLITVLFLSLAVNAPASEFKSALPGLLNIISLAFHSNAGWLDAQRTDPEGIFISLEEPDENGAVTVKIMAKEIGKELTFMKMINRKSLMLVRSS